MYSLAVLLLVLPAAVAQFPPFGRGDRFQEGNQGIQGGTGRFPDLGSILGGFAAIPNRQGGFAPGQSVSERSYYVKGRLLCGVQGAQGARVTLYENRNGASPFVYDETTVDGSGSFYVKAETRNEGLNGQSSMSQLSLSINHQCEGMRQMSVQLPQTYYHQGQSAAKTFDLGTINLEGRFSEEINSFNARDGISSGGSRSRFENRRNGNNNGGFGPIPVAV
ncbi:unnamed protein product [Strongylus vulgaris]|uniref:Uncharacterized protein n=1 Tax=Strongylus vulgaris TaxID=40348 RepID=A0A3P7LNQ7_STRVU|nr:unnamed protein product [Strongylus vulgaris]